MRGYSPEDPKPLVGYAVLAAAWNAAAIGELLVCPYCVGLWVAGGFIGAYVARPDATRMVAATFAVLGGSDFLQQAWTALDKRA